jgi:hypothetical protein
MSHLHPWYLTAAAIAASFCLALAFAYFGVWWGDRCDSREYRQWSKHLGKRPRCRLPDVDVDRNGRPILPAALANGTPVNGVRLSGPYRRVRR